MFIYLKEKNSKCAVVRVAVLNVSFPVGAFGDITELKRMKSLNEEGFVVSLCFNVWNAISVSYTSRGG